MLLCGYEFRMKKDQVYQYLDDKCIHYDNDSNIYEDDEGHIMYQIAPKIYNNEVEIIETKIDKDVYLITHLYKFIYNQKKKE